jgi:uncharacterized membrane protein YfcA
MSQKIKCLITGMLAGAANGFFGGGGGMILVPLLTRWIKLEERKAFATSIIIILPLCIVSVIIYFFRAELNFLETLPYLAGGLVGGAVGGRIFKNIPVNFLHKALGIIIIYGGIRCLL